MLPFGRMVQYGNIKPTVQIIDVKQSEYNMYVLYSNGRLFGRGYNSNGEMGLGDRTPKNLQWYELFSEGNGNVAEVLCGTSCTIIRTTNNKMYLAGWTASTGTVGNTYNLQFTEITNLFSQFDLSTVKIAMGARGIFVISNGVLYAIGHGTNSSADRYGNVGLGSVNSTSFKVVSAGGNVVTNVFSCIGSQSEASFYITQDGKLYSTGRNMSGTCGLGYVGETPTFTQVTLPETPRLVLLSNGSGSIVTVEGSMYSTGNSSSGRVGNGVSGGNLVSPTKNAVVSTDFVNGISLQNNTFFADYSLFALSNSVPYACGLDYNGWFGNGTASGTYTTFTPASSVINFSGLKMSCGAYSRVMYDGSNLYYTGKASEVFGVGTPDYYVFTAIPKPDNF